jgi:hypothetical protein
MSRIHHSHARLIRVNFEVLTSGDVANILKVAPRTVCKWCDNGSLPSWRLPANGHTGNKDRRVKRSVLIAFMREQQIPLALLTDFEAGVREAAGVKGGGNGAGEESKGVDGVRLCSPAEGGSAG